MQDILKMGICITFFMQAGTAIAGQVAVINPSSGGGIAIASTVSVPTVVSTITTPTATVTVPTATVSTPTVTVSAPTVTVSAPTATVSTPTATVSAPSTTVTTPETAGTLTRIVSALTNSTTTVTQEAGASASAAPSEGSSVGSEVASSTPSSVSGYAPQLMATIQSVNVTTFTPQQASTLISIIDAQISQPGTPASVRQALTIEKARLAVLASN